MSHSIKDNLDNPVLLEKLFRDNNRLFKKEFNLVYPEIKQSPAAEIWNARLNYENDKVRWGTGRELLIILALCFIAGLIAKIPDFTNIAQEYFYQRNIAFILFPMLSAYFFWKNGAQTKIILVAAALFVAAAVYINALPANENSDTLILACIHLPLFLWAITGVSFVGNNWRNMQRRLDFLRYNADLLVMTAIILIAGAILTAITFGLFELISIKIEDFYFEYIGIWGLASAPIFGTYLVQANPQMVNKVSPVIAKVFTPLVLITLVVYLAVLISTGKDPYTDRDFLLIFNLLLIGVMAIILFSIAETPVKEGPKIGTILLLLLSLVTIIVNGIALSAIIYRIATYGVTPNRIAVCGGNVLILINLLIVCYRLFKSIKNSNELEKVEESIARFLPVYFIWAMIITFILPVVFGFK